MTTPKNDSGAPTMRGDAGPGVHPMLELGLYDALVPWYPMIDAVSDHEEEAAEYVAIWEDAVVGPRAQLLELGSGAGNNAVYLQKDYRCTLVDRSSRMLELSKAQNPAAEHRLGDMRTLRLDRTFDAVLIHDSIVYMLTEDDLKAALETAFVHLRPGGAAIFAPDCTKESFRDEIDDDQADDGDRSLRYLAWMYDPDPSDSTYTVDYAFLLREGGQVHAVHDRHVEGLFTDATWRRLITEVGFEVEIAPRAVEFDVYAPHVYVGRRPAQ